MKKQKQRTKKIEIEEMKKQKKKKKERKKERAEATPPDTAVAGLWTATGRQTQATCAQRSQTGKCPASRCQRRRSIGLAREHVSIARTRQEEEQKERKLTIHQRADRAKTNQ
jgi:hypothetical protein